MVTTKNVIFDLGAVLIEWDAALAFADVFPPRDAA